MMGGHDALNGTGGCDESEWRGFPARELFLAATFENDVEKFSRLLWDEPELRRRVNDKDGDGVGILHVKAMNPRPNDRAVVKVIAEAGGNRNLQNKREETPLKMATKYSNVDMVEALLEYGARVGLGDYSGQSPITMARSKCRHSGRGSNNCCKIYKLVMEAKEKLENDTNLQKTAEELQLEGNVLFGNQKYEETISAYTKYRTFSNRAACHLKMAKHNLQDDKETNNS